MTRSSHRFRRPLLAAGLVAATVVVAGCGGGAPSPTELPSTPHPMVIVAVDGLRADRIGAFGATDGKTPNLDALARESVTFKWAFAQAPEGASSLATFLTGFYPTTHGVKKPGDALPGEARTLAETLSASGYDTAAFVDGEGVNADLGFAQGFSVFEARPGAGIRDLGARALAWMKDRAKKNYLVMIEAGDPIRARSAYDGALAGVDAFVGDLRKSLGDLGLDDRATLVVVGTNGADLGEHADAGPSLHATVTHVPLLVRFPGGARAREADEYVEIADLGPTLLAAAGMTPHGNVHGKSLLPLIRGEGKPPYVAFGESPYRGGERFVALGGYQLIHAAEGDRTEVYRLAEDPLGKNDVASAESQRASVLAGHLGAWEKLAAVSSLDPDKKSAPLDDATLQKLKSLGYVQ